MGGEGGKKLGRMREKRASWCSAWVFLLEEGALMVVGSSGGDVEALHGWRDDQRRLEGLWKSWSRGISEKERETFKRKT